MKKIYSLAFLFCFFAITAIAQPQVKPALDEENLKHQKDQTWPSFNIMRMDSSIYNTSQVTKGRKSMIVIFSPDCEHCKNFTKKLLAGIDSLKDVDFYFVTPIHDISPLRRFYSEFGLENYKNIKIVGRDYQFFIMDFYSVRRFPWVILYNEHKKLLKVFDNAPSVTAIRNEMDN